MGKIALLTGTTGQDGSYLAELLLQKGYTVHGIVRRASTFNTTRIDHLIENPNIFGKTFFTHYADLTDSLSISNIVSKIKPDELYSLGAQSHVRVSFDIPESTGQINAIGALNVLEAVKNHSPNTKVYNAGTSELFGGVPEEMPVAGYNEKSTLNPRSPYAVAKAYALYMTKNYREAYGLFAASGILFNHESPRRGKTFVTRKITTWFADFFKAKKQGGSCKKLLLGELDASRDWSHATDSVYAQWLILQQDKPEDFVISSGETHTIREFVELCFNMKGIKIKWEGNGVNEIGRCDGDIVIKIDPRLFRPTEVFKLLGDCTKAKTVLGWKPTYTFEGLVEDMIDSDLRLIGVNP